MGKGYRQGRLGEEIKKIISDLLLHGLKDPRLSGLITVSEVKVTSDGSLATCYITVLTATKDEDERLKEETDVIEGLQSAKGLIKKNIGNEIRLRHVPDLIFKIDRSMDYGRHISEVLNKLEINHEE